MKEGTGQPKVTVATSSCSAITRKGHGYRAARTTRSASTPSASSMRHGEPLTAAVQATWTAAFEQRLSELVIAIAGGRHHSGHAAPVGLARFAAAHPDRVFDVGIAEQHAVTSAAGMAAVGLHPVVAVYSTFLNRAFDQILMDVGLHHAGVTFVLDRAGVTGPDGPSHHGQWDVSLLGLVPGLQLCSPRDRKRLHEALARAIDTDDAPTVIRFSNERLPDDMEAVQTREGLDLLVLNDASDVTGSHRCRCPRGSGRRDPLDKQDWGHCGRPVWTFPVADALVRLAAEHRLVVSIEDNLVIGGLGSSRACMMPLATRWPCVVLAAR